MKRLLIIFTILLVGVSSFADPYELPTGTKTWGGASGWKSDINKIFNYFGATSGEPETDPTIIGPLNVTGTGNSYYAMPNNATFTDVITGLYLWTFYEGYPYVALNGILKRLPTFDELGLVTEGTAAADPSSMATGAIYIETDATPPTATIKTALGSLKIEGAYTLDPTPPIITGLTLAENGTTLTMEASEPITQGSGFNVTDLECVGPVTGTVAVDSVTSGDGTDTWVMELASAILKESEEGAVVLNYPGTTDGIEDGDGTDLAAITSMAVANNSTQTVVSNGSLGFIIGAGTLGTPSSTPLYVMATASDGSGILPSAAGDVSYGHIYIMGTLSTRTICLSIKDASGNNLASGSLSTSGTDYWVNIPLDTTVTLDAGVKYYPAWINAGRVESGAQTGIGLDYEGSATCGESYERDGAYTTGAISLIFNNTAGNPE